MGHPDLNIDVSQMSPLLESQQISTLHNQSVPTPLCLLYCHRALADGKSRSRDMFIAHQNLNGLRDLTTPLLGMVFPSVG